MIYKEKFKIGLKDIGKNNKLSNRAILEYLENIGAYHSDKVGYGANDNVKTGVSWILLEWKVQVLKRPVYGQTLNIHTWGKGMSKFFTYRDFEIYDENGNLCVIATSKWALIDTNKRKITRISDSIIEKYEPEETDVFPKREIEKLIEPETYISSMLYEVKRKDIDIIGHMHNLYYLDLAYEALPEDVYSQRTFDMVRISYRKEIRLSEKVKCSYAKDGKSHIVGITSEDGSVLHAIIELQQLLP